MTHPTIEQAKELAKWYAGLALAVSIYRYNNWNTLTEEERRELEQKHWSLESYSQDFLREAAKLVFEDVDKDLAVIGKTTAAITKDIGKLKTVQLMMDVIGAVMTLAGAIISKDTGVITKQAQNLADIWKQLSGAEKATSRSAEVPKKESKPAKDDKKKSPKKNKKDKKKKAKKGG